MVSHLLQYSSLYDSGFACNSTALDLAIYNQVDLWYGYCSWRKLFQPWHEGPGNLHLLSLISHESPVTSFTRTWDNITDSIWKGRTSVSLCMCVFQRIDIHGFTLTSWHHWACLVLPYCTDCIGPGIWRFWTPFPSPKGIFNHKPVTLLYFLHTEEIEGVNLAVAQGFWWLLQILVVLNWLFHTKVRLLPRAQFY